MAQQKIRGFFHRFTQEGKAELAEQSAAAASASLQRSAPPIVLAHPSSASRVEVDRPLSTPKRSATTVSPNRHVSPSNVETYHTPEEKSTPKFSDGNIHRPNDAVLPRSRQVSEASSATSKRSRQDDEDEEQMPTPKAVKTGHLSAYSPSHKHDGRASKFSSSALSSPPQTLPMSSSTNLPVAQFDGVCERNEAFTSSSLDFLSQTPSNVAASQRTAVQSSQDSDEAEVLYSIHRQVNDGDTDEELESDSGSSIADLDFSSVAKPQLHMTPDGSTRALPSEPKTARTTRSQVGTVRTLQHYTPVPFNRPEPSARFSLAKMVKQNQKEAAAQVEIARHREVLEAARLERDADTASFDMATHEGMLQTLADSDDSDSQTRRLKLAMGRTEAMQVETNWYFFDGAADEGEDDGEATFPDWQVAEQASLCHLCDPNLREHSLLMGFAAERIARENCPAELRLWLWESAFSQRQEMLTRAHLDAFKACKDDMASFLQPDMIRKTLLRLGASENACSLSAAVKSTANGRLAKAATATIAPWKLALLLETIGDVAERLDSVAKVYMLSMLLKMGVDRNLVAEGTLRRAMHVTTKKIVDSLNDGKDEERLSEVGHVIFESISSVTLRSQLVAAMPETSLRLHEFKRRLALAFSLDDAQILNERLVEASDLPVRISLRLRQIDVMDAQMDYTGIAALASLLDVGIAGGFPVELSGKEGERKFNDNVDAMSRHVKALFSRIIDTGASHMGRTEAKGVLERLQYRLDFGVRSKAKPKQSILVEPGRRRRRSLEMDAKSVSLMASFLKKGEQPAGNHDSAVPANL